MDDQYVEARFFMLMSSLGSHVVPGPHTTGNSVGFASADELEDYSTDEGVLKSRLSGMANTEAIDLILTVQTNLRTKALREATLEQISKFFG